MKSFPAMLHRFSRLFTIALFLLAAMLPARAVNLVQEFYLPMPEAQINQANNAIIAGTSSTINSIFSIVVTGTGTVIYYDQWEDGYEVNLASPTQSTTQIWGDGNTNNGVAPGYPTDILPVGGVITLTNAVPQPRNPSVILWDARDRVAANKALVISRAAWPVTPGPVFGGAAGVLSTIDYGTNFISPVGQNLTNNLFKYVGMFVMAAQNNTAVTIDPNGTGLGTTSIVLNQGESYLVNGGVLKGGRVTATKSIQADLIIGHVGASYAADWFTLYPVESWSPSYYTPVGSAASVNQPAYVYLYNPGTNAITINCTTKVGSIPVSVPGTNGVYQFQMPVGSGANFASAGNQNFYALETVAANNGADTAYNWGFTLVPKGGLTTEATVGWGPGSADGTVNGSPVWITALGNTTLYVDYKGDHAGPLAYTNGSSIQNYDTNFTVTALQSLKIFDPSKNQTGMRVFTVDGTLVAGAWGEDADTAAPGNPYIDAGTTVIPFPTPLLFKSVTNNTSTNGLHINDTLTYTVQVNNQGLLPLGNTVVIDSPTTNLTYVTNTTTYNSSSIPDNPGPYNATNTAFPLDAYGSAGYTIPIILSQGVSTFTYQAKVNASGAVSNSVNIGGTTITTQTFLPPPSTNSAPLAVNFSDTNGVTTNLYTAGANVFVTMTNGVANTSSNTVQTINVTVIDTNTGDVQTITLTETSTNSSVFRNLSGLPTSTSSGLAQQDGTLYVAPGDTLSVSYTDPTYGTSASATAQILVPAPNKQLYLTANGTPGAQQMNRKNPAAFPGNGTTNISVNLGSVTNGSVTLDSVTTVSNTALTATFGHITSTGGNRLMLVGVSMNRATGTSLETVTNVTYAGQNLTLVGSRTNTASGEAVVWIYALTNPPAGSNNVVVSFDKADADGEVIGCATFTGVNQATPYGAFFSNTGTSTSVSLTVNSAAGELVFDTVMLRSSDFGASGSPGAGQTTLWKTYYNARVGAGASTQPGAATVTDTWTSAASVDWAIGAVSIKPALSTGTNVTSFAQTNSFASAFKMPAGGTVSITNFITITNGSLSASPAITATLKYNGTNFITLTNPTYAANALIWSGQLPGAVTVPAGQLITYVISNFQSTATFQVNYGATNVPSQIVLPASTIISITTNGVYDAPYPGGNLINSPVAGSTVYQRTAVSDPFGYYDITSLGLVVTGPVGFSTNLTDVNVVYTNGAVKIYEFAVTTGPNTGTYNLAVTANEGTEGVKVSTATSVTTTFLDLGTPSITSFTAGPNGVDTNSYLANSLVSVRVSDLNRNTNSATVDTVSVTITNSAGDFETLTLVETGTNTGIFTNSINASTNSVNLPTNGTLYAPVGSVITVNYTDPTDTSDSTSATAIVQPLPGVPGVVMNKTILSPSGGQVGVSNNITFNLQAVNVGSTTLANLSLSDTFPAAKLSFVSASLTPSTISAGLLTWTNLGAFTPGQSTNITVTFLTLATGATTNFATANGGTATNNTFVPFAINRTALNVTKTLLSPTNTPVAVGSNVVFRITVQNTGNVTVNYLPMEDSFSAAYYQFVSSTITNNGSGAGSLIWTNLASPTALVAGATITNDVTMKVVGQGSPANNTATVDFATDINGNPVPTTTSTIGVNTAAGSISGHVYNDLDTNGIVSAGDTPLAGVTLQLYTDPNGDGSPADGALVQLTTTDASGYYEFLNLNIGRYVIVENHLPGYDSSSPSSNQKAINLPTLTATNNVNFFDFQPPPSQYSTISGQVWNDTNGNGTNNVGETNIANVSLQLFEDNNTNGLADLGEPLMGSATTDANGNYSFFGVTPGRYVILETDPYGYYSTGDSQGTNNNQITFVSTNGIVSTNNSFYDRLSPIAVNDTTSALYFVSTNISPLTNDISPNGDPLTITNVSSTNGLVVINPGSTNLTFTPTNLGVTTITYTVADAHGGTSTATITVNVTELANLAIGKTASSTVFATSNLTYTISVTNLGPTPASLVVVTDTLPVGVTFVSASGGGVTNAGLVTWNLGTLTNNQTSNLTVIVTAPVSGSLTNTANVNSPTPDPTPTNNVTPPVITSVTPVANVGLGKTALATV
ncbi:MAG: SdrD B-like domain-containing protein, partial [Verrucomicrobiae bacterium]